MENWETLLKLNIMDPWKKITDMRNLLIDRDICIHMYLQLSFLEFFLGKY